MRGALKAHPGFPSRSRILRPPGAWVRRARMATDARAAAIADCVWACGRVVDCEHKTPGILLPSCEWRRRSVAVLAINNFHDGFAVTGAGNTAGFLIRVTTAPDQRR